MKKLIAFALATLTVAAVTGSATADSGKRVGPFAGAIHADVTALLKDGSSASAKLDRGTVTAVDSSTLTLERFVDKTSLTFAINADTWYPRGQAKVGDKLGVVSQNGTALRVNVWNKLDPQTTDRVGPFRTAVHADISLLMKDSSTKSETMDRGKVTAISSSSLTIARADGQSVTFSIDDKTVAREKGQDESLDSVKVGDRLMVFATDGHAFLLRCITHDDKAAAKK
jgi:preprotein translocase subunit YajC